MSRRTAKYGAILKLLREVSTERAGWLFVIDLDAIIVDMRFVPPWEWCASGSCPSGQEHSDARCINHQLTLPASAFDIASPVSNVQAIDVCHLPDG